MDAPRIEKQMRNESETASNVRLLSVGHSNHDCPTFVDLLCCAGVAALADVRSSPYSRRYPHFNREPLREGLRQHGIAYEFLGDLLGGRPASLALYDGEGQVDYERVRATDQFQRGLDCLTCGQSAPILAFLCSEEDPLDCHRGLMIAPALTARGVTPGHLRKNGVIETNEAMEGRLLKDVGLDADVNGLFAALLAVDERRTLVSEAYRRMARRKAYRLPRFE